MNKTIASILLTLFLAVSGLAQAPADRYIATAGGFSLRPPTGWKLEQKEGEKYKSAFGPASEVFVPNLNFKDAVNAIALAEYADASVEYILKTYEKFGATNLKLISRTDFVTDSKERGVKIVFRCEYKGMQINTAQYYFDTGVIKLIATFTALESEKAVNDKLFDAAVKTLQIEH
jgi:hypothetical protein